MQEAAGRQSSSAQEEAAANLAAVQAKIRELEAALAQAHGTVSSQLAQPELSSKDTYDRVASLQPSASVPAI